MSSLSSALNKFINFKCGRCRGTFIKSVLYKEKSTDVIQIRQTRTHYSRNPPGVKPYDPKAIPWARQQNKGGGALLIVIPVTAFALGTWQIKRLKWKTELIETINRRISMDPVPLPLDPEEVAQMEFQKVTVTGTFDHENERLYGPKLCLINGEPNPNIVSKTGQGSHGFNLITPLVLSDSGERILVNRGWVQTKEIQQQKRPWSFTKEEQTITGVVRSSEPPNWVAAHGDPKYKTWHIRDIEGMAEDTDCLPIFIDATSDHSIPNHLWAGQTRVQLRNEHLSYVLTWFALSIATGFMWYAKYVKR